MISGCAFAQSPLSAGRGQSDGSPSCEPPLMVFDVQMPGTDSLFGFPVYLLRCIEKGNSKAYSTDLADLDREKVICHTRLC